VCAEQVGPSRSRFQLHPSYRTDIRPNKANFRSCCSQDCLFFPCTAELQIEMYLRPPINAYVFHATRYAFLLKPPYLFCLGNTSPKTDRTGVRKNSGIEIQWFKLETTLSG